MAVEWVEHDGVISVTVDGRLPKPFLYILAGNPPPWYVEPLGTGHDKQPFDTLDAAKFALLLSLKGNDHEDQNK